MMDATFALTLGSAATRAAVIWTIDLGLIVLAAGMLACVYRLLRGPHLADRAMAVDTLAIQVIGVVLLLGIRIGTLTFIDGILVLSLLGFAGSVAMAQYIARPHRNRPSPTHSPSPQERSA